MVKCDICGKELKNKRGLKIHKSRKHKKEKNKDKKTSKKTSKDSKKNKKEKSVQVCPKCGSPRIDYASMDTRSVRTVIGLGTPNKYYCKDCGYEGMIKIKTSIDGAERIKEDARKKKAKEKEEKKKTPVILKPLSIILIIGFLITAIFIAMTPIETETTPYIPFGRSIEEEPLNLTEEESDLLEEPLEAQPDTEPVRRATGITIIGFLVPMFIIFFLVGLLVYMIWYYMERISKHN